MRTLSDLAATRPHKPPFDFIWKFTAFGAE